MKQGMVAELKSFTVSNNEEAQKAIEGALWNLEGKEKQIQINLAQQEEEAKKVLTNQGQEPQKQHVMISYSWAQKDRMRQIGSHLKSLGYPVWLDIEQMEGSVLERMSEAVEQAAVLIIGLSTNYKESQACRTEAEYAYRLKKQVIFVMAEDGYTATGWLGAMLGNKFAKFLFF